MSYDGIVFDMDRVLLDSAGDGFKWANDFRRKKAKQMGYEDFDYPEGFVFTSRSFEEMKAKVEKSRLDWDEAIQMEKAAARKKMEMVRNGDIELFKESEQVLEKLELPAAVVSNAFGDILEEIVIEFGIDRHLEYWIAPRLEEIETYHSIWKPETHMLEKAMEEMGSENPVMVGDDWFDIKSADNARIDSVLVERGHNDIEIEPTHRLSSLKELKEIVDESQS